MADVFVSYNSADIEKTERVISSLKENHIDYWFDKECIPKGEPYDDMIPDAISQCPVLLVLLSENSIESENVKDEIRLAKTSNKRIIPFMLENIDLKKAFSYHIISNSRINAYLNWDSAITELVAELKSQGEQAQRTSVSMPRKYVRCPKCGNTILKREYDFLELYLTPKPIKDKGDSAIVKLIHLSIAAESCLGHVGSVLLLFFCLFIIPRSEESQWTNILHIGRYFLAALSVFFSIGYHCFKRAYPNISKQLKRTLKNSEMTYYNLKCVKCEEEFGVIRPNDESINDFVEQLIEECE